MKNTDYIKRFSFFSGLQEEDLNKIASIAIERNYKKNMVIFMEGEPGEAFYYIKSGKVKVYNTYADGHEHILYIFSEGDVFGEATLFNNINYPASAIVYEDAVIGMIKNRDLEQLIMENSELSLKIIKILVRKLVFSQQKLKELTFNDVFSRTASQILKLSKDYGRKCDMGTVLDIQLSRQEMAEMIGSTRETVSRVISRFKKEKAIAEDKDKIIIINEEKLKEWI